MSDLPEGGGNVGFWMGLGALVTAIGAVAKNIWDSICTNRQKAKDQQAKLDADASDRKQSEDTATAKRKHDEEVGTIAQWQDFAKRQGEEIARLNTCLDSKDVQVSTQQSAINSLYRQCSGLEIDVTEQQSAIIFFYSLSKRLAAQLKENKLPCEDVPEPPPKPMRRGDQEGPDYVMRVTRQNTILREATAQKQVGVGGVK